MPAATLPTESRPRGPASGSPVPPAPRRTPSAGAALVEALNRQETVMLLAMVLVLVGVTLVNPGFIGAGNLVDILFKSSYVGVAAIGMAMIIICGHIDISIGAIVGVAATVAGRLAVSGYPLPVVFAATILTGVVLGTINGCVVAFLRIPAIVATLAMASLLKGTLILATGGKWIYGLPPDFAIAHHPVLGVPLPILTLTVLGVAFSLWLRYTTRGREVYAVGGNAEAARLAGVSARGVTVRVFALNGLLLGLAAVLYATNFSAIQSNAVPGLELSVITAAVIGGVSILGGTGTAVGAILGAVLLQIIGTALVFLHIRAEWFLTVQGALILLTILLDVFRRRRAAGSGALPSGAGAGSAPLLRVGPFAVQEVVLAGLLVTVVTVLSFTSDRFFTSPNLLNQTRFLTETALIAVPMTFVIITGGIDLSVGSVLAFSAIVFGFSWQSFGLPLPVAALIGLAGGAFAGYLNGRMIVSLGVPPLIVTLATLAIFRGLAFGISQSRSVNGFPESFGFLGSGELAGLPVQFYILVAVWIVSGLALARTPFGRTLYAIGNNETAARFAGLRVRRVKLLAYTLSGLCAAVAGIIFTSRVTTTRPDAGTGLELDVIAAVVFGGTSIFGGRGTMLGTVLGVVTIQLLKNGLQLSGVRGEGTVILIGSVLLLSIVLSQFFEGRAFRRSQRRTRDSVAPAPAPVTAELPPQNSASVTHNQP